MILNAWILLGLGVILLVFVIPLMAKISDGGTKTEFFSARGAYWCIIAGTTLLLLAALDTCIVDAISLLKR